MPSQVARGKFGYFVELKLIVSALAASIVMSTTPIAFAEDKPLRIGIARMTHAHVHALLHRSRDADVELVGIAEPNAELANRLVDQYGIDRELVFADLDTMLAETKPTAVAAYGSILEHLPVVEACAPLGVHVMVEKPLAVSGEHAQRMAALAREHGIVLLTNYETTWYGSNHALYDRVVERGEVGELRKLVVHDGHPGPIEIGCYPEFVEWLTDPEQNGGGAITDFGCYGANLATWLLDNERPLTVTGVTQQIKPDKYPHVDDEATILLTYPQTQVIVQASWNWPINRKDLHAYGETGYIKTIDDARMLVRLDEKQPEQALSAPPLTKPRHDPFAYLHAAIRGDVDASVGLSSLENNLIVVEILDAARESARTGRTIELPRDE